MAGDMLQCGKDASTPAARKEEIGVRRDLKGGAGEFEMFQIQEDIGEESRAAPTYRRQANRDDAFIFNVMNMKFINK
ncbi:hypothetical protein [Denitratisoma sp. DHT3]|uniref:hypothetical protein n=1 Tax=Denitratisoma sp. DHT3 TaxID=1981880 RepID=UPI00164897F0|nr:hypothetical protein [Denitratisoma sp. DHT3]